MSSRHPLRSLFENPRAFATPLCVAMLDIFGTEAIQWDMTTLALEVRDEIGARMSGHVFERLLTGFFLLKEDSFFKSPVDFSRGCLVLSGHDPVGFAIPEAEDCAWGITEAMLLTGEDGDEPFSREVQGLVGAVCQQEGILDPPDVLKIGGPGQASRVKQDFSDDAVMYQSIFEIEKDRTKSITNLVAGRLRALLEQLHGLPLVNGTTTHVSRLLESLPPVPAMPLGVVS